MLRSLSFIGLLFCVLGAGKASATIELCNQTKFETVFVSIARDELATIVVGRHPYHVRGWFQIQRGGCITALGGTYGTVLYTVTDGNGNVLDFGDDKVNICVDTVDAFHRVDYLESLVRRCPEGYVKRPFYEYTAFNRNSKITLR